MTCRIALVSCVKQKRTSAAPARDLYVSELFRGLRRYGEARADAWFILSAEYGLLRPDQVVSPYERTLNTMRRPERLAWAARVQRQLLEVLPPSAHVILLAGARYRENLEPFLRGKGYEVSVPLEGMALGKQLQYLRGIAR